MTGICPQCNVNCLTGRRKFCQPCGYQRDRESRNASKREIRRLRREGLTGKAPRFVAHDGIEPIPEAVQRACPATVAWRTLDETFPHLRIRREDFA
jgi:hypothetical protein